MLYFVGPKDQSWYKCGKYYTRGGIIGKALLEIASYSL